MTDFRDVLRAELVAAAERPLPRRTLVPARPVLLRGGLLAAAAVAAALAIFVLPWGAGKAPQPAQRLALPGQPLFGGSLDDGVRYATRELQPAISFRVTGRRWFVYDATSPTTLVLQRREGNPAAGLERPPELFLAYVRFPTVIDPGTGDVGPAPADLVGWLRSNPNLGISAVTRTRLFGHPATRLAFHVPARPARVAPDCGFSKPWSPGQLPEVATCAAIAPSASLAAGSAGYLIVPDGADPLVAAEISLVPSRVGEIVRQAAPMLDSTLIAR